MSCRVSALLLLTALVMAACGTKAVEIVATPAADSDDITLATAADEPGDPSPTSADPAVPSATPADPATSAVLISGGTSFGLCAGFCTTEVTFEAGQAGGRISGDVPEQVIVTFSSRDDIADHVVRGDLTDVGRDALAGVGAGLTSIELQETYGCPDCADGGSAWVVVAQQDMQTGALSTYEFSAPPVDLVDADAFMTGLIEALRTCETNELVVPADACAPPPVIEPPSSEEAAIVLGAGTSFGECAGYCKTDLLFDDGQVTLTASTWKGEQPDHVITGTLTEKGFTELDAIGASIRDAELEVTYGCPDCADGGKAEIVLAGADGSRITSSYEYANPPTELVDADRFTSSVIEALIACSANDLVESHADCMPKP